MKFEENIEEKEYGLVLAGGGTKGAYQVGVYKAFKGNENKCESCSGNFNWSFKWCISIAR